MKSCVLIKQVPDGDSPVVIADDQVSLKSAGISWTTNETDSYALEEALLLKEAHGGEVVVCTIGKDSALQVVKDALAKGADRGIFITDPQFDHLDSYGKAAIFAQVLKAENFDLIFSGLQSDNSSNAQTGLILAEFLGTAHATMVIGTEWVDDSKIKVNRELEAGWFRWTELDFPASLTIQSGINKPRYASLRGIMLMKKKPITTITSGDLKMDEIPTLSRIKKLYIPRKTKETVFISGSPEEIVTQLTDKLENEIKVL